MVRFFKREEKSFTYTAIEERKSHSKVTLWVTGIILLVVLTATVIWQSPLRSKFEYIGYRMGILVIDSCISFGVPPQGGMVCSYKFDSQALLEKLTNPKKLPHGDIPAVDQ